MCVVMFASEKTKHTKCCFPSPEDGEQAPCSEGSEAYRPTAYGKKLGSQMNGLHRGMARRLSPGCSGDM